MEPLDLILYGGPILTGLQATPQVAALGIRDGKVVVWDSEAGVLTLAGPRTKRVYLRGKAAVPGFHDSHQHLHSGGLTLLNLDLRGCASPDEVAQRVADAPTRARYQGWIVGRGWDETAFAGHEGLPDHRILDRCAPGTPVFLWRVDGHTAWLNQAALDAAGVDATTPDPPGGRIVRADGHPTGILMEEAAWQTAKAVLPQPDEARQAEGLRAALKLMAGHGITTAQDHLGDPARYQALEEAGELTLRVRAWADLFADWQEVEELRTRFPSAPGDMVRLGMLKGFVDGTLGSRTALMSAPYADAPGQRGMSLHSKEELLQRVVEADRRGFQVGLHAIGDLAVTWALDAFEAASKANGARDARHRVEHAQTVHSRDLERFAQLGVIPSVQPVHLLDDWALLDRIPPPLKSSAYPYAALLQAGARVAFGSDFPVSHPDPLKGLLAACCRGAPGTDPYGPEQALPMEEAVRCYSYLAAHSSFDETALGGLAPGMWADIAILDSDAFLEEPAALAETRVQVTLLAGKVVGRG